MPTKGGKKGRKIGRNVVKCKQYRAEGRREKNKLKRIIKHGTMIEAETYAKKHKLPLPK